MADYDVIVIGAGCGGLSAGSLLAKQGRKVLVLDQGDMLGGCCSSFERDGYTFDSGASVVEVIHSIEQVFELLGTTLQKEVDLIPCDPVYSYIARDGSRINYPYSVEGKAELISEISPEDGKSWLEFADYFKGFLAETLKGFFSSPMNSFTDFAQVFAKTPGLLKYMPLFLNSYQGVMEKYFKNDLVKQSMAYQAEYLGLPPELTPGVFALLAYSEHEGVYYPKGGMIAIPGALKRVGEKLGMEVRMNTKVDKVIVRNRRAEGVVLADGTEITTNVVVSDINAKMLYLEMIGEEHLKPLSRYGIKSYELSLSVPMIYVGVDYEPPLDAHHSIISPSMEELADNWWNRHRKGLMPKEQFGLVCWPTKSDPSLAPKGHHTLNIILMGPYHLQGTDWDKEKQSFLEGAISYLSDFAIPGLADHVVHADIATPMDFERKLMLPEGAIYSLQQDLSASTVFRVSSKSKSIQGLYLCGSSTHPGGGVPTTIASGMIAANLIDQYE